MNSLVKIVFLALLAKAMGLVSVDIEGSTYESFGLVGFGRIPSNAVDKYQETIAPGSSVQIERSSLKVDSKGVYHFTAWGLPDRGMNVDGTVNTFSRIHKFNVDFTPKNSSSSDNIVWTYEDTILLTDFNGQYLSGLDSNTTVTFNGNQVPAVTYHGDGWGSYMNSSTTTTRLSLDSESLTFIDGNIENGFWIGDEYGPSLIKFDSTGKMIDYIEAPEALLPHVNGKLFFSSDDTLWTDPYYSVTPNDDGRTGNHGYEGMDITPDGKYLFTLLQSATVQDGGDKSKSRMNDRLLKYDISSSPATLVGEYVVVLPTYEENGKTKTASQSEMRIVNENLIMALPRDSDLGRGGEDGTKAIFKHVDFWSLTDAENIVGKYDDAGAQIATGKGVLNSDITPATHYSFIDLLDDTELAKFNVHNGGADDDHLINEKWEGMTLIPVQCTTDEYFLLLISDNDYKTTDGFLNYGKITFDSGIDVDTQTLMFHIKLPTLPHDQSCSSASSSSSPSSSRLISSSAPVSSSESTKSSVSSSAKTESSGSSVPAGSSSSSSSSSSPVLSSTPASSSSSSSSPSASPSSSSSSSSSSSLTTATPSSAASSAPSSSSSSSSTLTSSTSSSAASSVLPSSISSSSSAQGPESTTISDSSSVSNTIHTTVVDGVTTTVTEPCERCTKTSTGSTALTTYTTVSNGATITVTAPCPESSTSAKGSYTTYTTVSAGTTITVTAPCSVTTAASGSSSTSSSSTASKPTPPTSAAPSSSIKTVETSATSASSARSASSVTSASSARSATSGSSVSISTASTFHNAAPSLGADSAALILPAVAAFAAAMV
ncbi:hypothetical protein PICMEDRAFT_14824 [Pichia membranifaciens NRRL Y-2026]|uniref:Phytase-like domain-containing protein n=1 Tax=Pichia membranifaciens NRRL Y-2026 TaxID=763406 RepID=A0A1E3NTN8_9ASCO|nr:hypothetical protein PICMEDRAFT_14824 [Pichia membranifaciens NRRL Y-2026]ODQ49356.1 hypothetical protein PICMEDRAFT_14824 [Pichia membranifaciens NRRL Y-2026]